MASRLATHRTQEPPAFSTHADVLLHDLRDAPLDEYPALLRRLDLSVIARFVRFDHARYARVTLAQDERVEILAMGWLPTQRSLVHDHGESQGAGLVLSGVAVEERFVVAPEGRLRLARTQRLMAGDSTLERPREIHRMINPGPDVLLTLHAYSPPLSRFETYEAP